MVAILQDAEMSGEQHISRACLLEMTFDPRCERQPMPQRGMWTIAGPAASPTI
jgi:hypothetical protein